MLPKLLLQRIALLVSTCPILGSLPLSADEVGLITAAEIADAISSAEFKMALLADRTLNGNASVSVAYTDGSGRWISRNTSVWTSGHLAGIFWMLYERTGKEEWKTRAQRWTEALASRVTAADNDTGFQIFCSYGLGVTLGGVDSDTYHNAINNAALELVRQRYNPTIGCLRSWPENRTNPNDMPFEVNIDQLMNLELILYAADKLDRQDLVDVVISHADRTWEHNVRQDASTYHVVEYNAAGEVVNKRTHQGWQASSTWSRGQAWAIYGYVMIYRYTGESRFLERSIACLDYFTSAVAAQSPDGIAFSDFDAALDSKNPRDTSANAIVASASMELFTLTGEQRFRTLAGQYLGTLHRSFLTKGSSHQAVLFAGSEKWGLGEVGTIFGDYYFIEAMSRFAETLSAPEPTPLTLWAGFVISNNYYADTGSMLGVLYTGYAPWVYAYDQQRWIYLPEQPADESGVWLLLKR